LAVVTKIVSIASAKVVGLIVTSDFFLDISIVIALGALCRVLSGLLGADYLVDLAFVFDL